MTFTKSQVTNDVYTLSNYGKIVKKFISEYMTLKKQVKNLEDFAKLSCKQANANVC